jgi:hypothetical protein
LLAAQVAIDDLSAPVRNFRHDINARVSQIEDPRSTFGLGEAGITGRGQTGTFDAPVMKKAQRDIFASWQQGTESSVTYIWGSVAGNRFAVHAGPLVFTGKTPTDVDGKSYVTTPFGTTTSDDGLHICFW